MVDRPVQGRGLAAVALLLALTGLAGAASGQRSVCSVDRAKALTPANGEESPIRHVVVVLLDDVGRDGIDCYGFPNAGPTPTIDGMAAAGIRFTRAYANPVCSPTRACALTGRYGSRTGCDTGVSTYNPTTNPNGPFTRSLDEPWLARLLATDGERSYLIGKWHLATIDTPDFHQHPILCGFVRWRGHLANLNDGQGESVYNWKKQVADANGWAENTTTTYVTADNALEAWLALQASAGQPSMVWLAFNAPHAPWNDLPPSGTYTPVSGPQTDAKKQRYALQSLDTYLGQLRSFYASQLPDDAAHTLWIVMGDNGTPAAANLDMPAFSHKATVYEGGVGVPLIVCGAGVDEPGRVSDHLVHAVDLHATLLELLGAPRATRTDSVSFADVIGDAGATPARTSVYCREASPNGPAPKDWVQHCGIDARWKLIERQNLSPAHQLFDLSVDPTELVNQWPANTTDETAAVVALQAVIDAGSAP